MENGRRKRKKEKKIEFYEMRKCCWLLKRDDGEMSDGKTSAKVETKQCQINLHFLFVVLEFRAQAKMRNDEQLAHVHREYSLYSHLKVADDDWTGMSC